jgi:type II secretory pathway pseudopilin PulG
MSGGNHDMKINDSNGLTLIELLVTLTIAFSIMGIVTGVLVQSINNANVVETNINLRQEANILISTIKSAHMSSITNDKTTYEYSVGFNKSTTTNNWELTIGNTLISNQNYNILLELEQSIPGETLPRIIKIEETTVSIDPNSNKIVKRQPLFIKKVKLISKKDSSKTFEISTTISRL